MIKHIVMWKLKKIAEGNTAKENALKAKSLLENLDGKVPGLITIEVGVDYSKTDDSADIVLYSEFESQEALDAYHTHPEHKKVIPFMREIRDARTLVDYET